MGQFRSKMGRSRPKAALVLRVRGDFPEVGERFRSKRRCAEFFRSCGVLGHAAKSTARSRPHDVRVVWSRDPGGAPVFPRTTGARSCRKQRKFLGQTPESSVARRAIARTAAIAALSKLIIGEEPDFDDMLRTTANKSIRASKSVIVGLSGGCGYEEGERRNEVLRSPHVSSRSSPVGPSSPRPEPPRGIP